MTAMRSLLLPALLAVPLIASAQQAQMHAPLQDPWVPPAVRKALPQVPTQAPTQGAALKAQVESKLRAGFAAADTDGGGTITLAQARAAGLGFVANNFREIDTAHTGRVSFDDVKRYLRRQGADI